MNDTDTHPPLSSGWSTLEGELQVVQHDLAHSLPFHRGQAFVHGESQTLWDQWEAELEAREGELLAALGREY